MTQVSGLQRHLSVMTRFHSLAYQRLFDVLSGLSDEQYRRDLGLFFNSIHGTVNHLHLVDCLWHWRIEGVKPEFWVTGLGMEVEADREALLKRTIDRAEAFHRFVDGLSEQRLLDVVSAPTLSGERVDRPAHLLVMTVVNHGTHHRGQICAGLTLLGVEYPALDLPFYDELFD